ncbi:PREDICTED: intersectin-1-like isoform X2 [Branchiostoma belcheri]|uniref:Intersectin-1-like isoform X2 n=1 Tax=Branchiostoma belcheri TaxID=7741 RepID=A0A6P4Z0F4_BRABE|nr:PREDICTED: intersectin-1-like isoform X2 [Branchiostoma belcheri]
MEDDYVEEEEENLHWEEENYLLDLENEIAEFSQRVAAIQEQNASQIQSVCETFRERNRAMRKDWHEYPDSLFECWDVLLEEVESDAQVSQELASSLVQNVSQPLGQLAESNRGQTRKMHRFRDAYETHIEKAEAELQRVHKEYTEAWLKAKHDSRESHRSHYLSVCHNLHNAYLLQLTAVNTFNQAFYTRALPEMVDDLEDLHLEMLTALSMFLGRYAKTAQTKALEKSNRMDMLVQACRTLPNKTDIKELTANFAPDQPQRPIHRYTKPEPEARADFLQNALVLSDATEPALWRKYDMLKKEIEDLEILVQHTDDAIASLESLYRSHTEMQLYSKARETQEDITKKKSDIRMAEAQLSVCRAQMKLFSPIFGGPNPEDDHYNHRRKRRPHHDRDRDRDHPSRGSRDTREPPEYSHRDQQDYAHGNSRERDRDRDMGHSPQMQNRAPHSPRSHQRQYSSHQQLSSHDQIDHPRRDHHYRGGDNPRSYDHQGPPHSPQPRHSSRQQFNIDNIGQAHQFQEYTYKKPTFCDQCKELLRGIMKQGVRCKNCKMNVHHKCQDSVPSCTGQAPPSPADLEPGQGKGLRRQKSSSDIDYKARLAFGKDGPPSSTLSSVENPSIDGEGEGEGGLDPVFHSLQVAKMISAANRKGISTSNPASPKARRSGTSTAALSSVGRAQSSPVKTDNAAKPVDDKQKAQPQRGQSDPGSGGDTSKSNGKVVSTGTAVMPPKGRTPFPLLKLAVALHKYEPTRQEDLMLRPGDRVQITDDTDTTWWKGKCSGKIGFFPANYVLKVAPGAEVLQCTETFGGNPKYGEIEMTKGDICVQLSDEGNGWFQVQTETTKGSFPAKYLLAI